MEFPMTLIAKLQKEYPRNIELKKAISNSIIYTHAPEKPITAQFSSIIDKMIWHNVSWCPNITV